MRYMWLTLACPRNISCNFGTSRSKLKKNIFLVALHKNPFSPSYNVPHLGHKGLEQARVIS